MYQYTLLNNGLNIRCVQTVTPFSPSSQPASRGGGEERVLCLGKKTSWGRHLRGALARNAAEHNLAMRESPLLIFLL
jgi:hypothetical protein